MTHPASSERVAALREEIQRAGHASVKLRARLAAGIALPLGAAALRAAIVMTPEGNPSPNGIDPATFLVLMPGLLLTLGVTCLVSLPAACGYRERQRAKLRRRMAALPRGEQASVLASMKREFASDTRKIVLALRRELALANEVTPAT